MGDDEKKHFNSLQMLRGIAAALVVFFHGVHSDAFSLFQYGYMGVDIFFVLSGFIIFYIHYSDIGIRKNYKLFIIKRFVRVYPFYLIVTLLYIGLIIPFGHNLSISYFIKSILLLPQGQQPIVGVAWTLQYELLFYFIFSLLIINRKIFYPLFFLWGGTVIFFLIWPSVLLKVPIMQLIFNPINLEFLFGCAIALIVLKKKIKYSKWITSIGILTILISLLIQHYNILTMNRVIAWGIPSASIILGLINLELHKNIQIPRVFIYLGNASYSIYLTHLLTLLILQSIFERLSILNEFINPGIAEIVFCITSILIGCIFHSFLERPLLKYLKNKFIISNRENKDTTIHEDNADKKRSGLL